MKLILKILALIFFVSSVTGQENEKLYPITNNNLLGYINSKGEQVIKPQYHSAGQFSEGVAAARLNGTYGYINQTGNFIIKPQFDFALPFKSGQAKVFINEKPYFIDKRGNITFEHDFKSITSFENHTFAIAITQSDKYCLINRNGKLLTDTVFKKINPFTDGVSVVNGLNDLPYPKDSTQIEKFETGVIDTTGKMIIHFGVYKDIGRFTNGYTTAVRFNQTKEERGWTRDDAVIDQKGNLKFIIPPGRYFLDFNNKGFYDDLAVVQIYPKKNDSTKNNRFNNDKVYKGVINTNGVILFSDTNWEEITPFRYNRAFVKDKKKRWKMINTNGEQVGDSTFQNILYETYNGNPDDIFINGTAWVKLVKGWVSIDTNGTILTEPKIFKGIRDNRLTRVGDIIFIDEDISLESDRYSYRTGFWNPKTNLLIDPIYHDIDMYGFESELIYASKDGIIHYINSFGKVVWKDTENKVATLKNLNIDFMNRGYFYAYSKPNKRDLGGFGSSSNMSKNISKSTNLKSNTLNVIVHPELMDTIYESNNAYTVYITNSTKKDITFNAQDSRLYMKVQALDSRGVWKDIEYLPSSWCGNSYHTLTLEPKKLWSFITPVYDGEFKTKLRIELKYIDPNDESKKRWEKKEITVYSNIYEGGINPGQFWNKRTYYPSGLMDPYND